MDRRRFLKVSSLACGGSLAALAEAPMPMVTLGKTGMTVSRIAVGGWDMSLKSIDIGVGIVQRAVELGVNFFDSAYTYNEGRSDQVYGKVPPVAPVSPPATMHRDGTFPCAICICKSLKTTIRT